MPLWYDKFMIKEGGSAVIEPEKEEENNVRGENLHSGPRSDREKEEHRILRMKQAGNQKYGPFTEEDFQRLGALNNREEQERESNPKTGLSPSETVEFKRLTFKQMNEPDFNPDSDDGRRLRELYQKTGK